MESSHGEETHPLASVEEGQETGEKEEVERPKTARQGRDETGLEESRQTACPGEARKGQNAAGRHSGPTGARARSRAPALTGDRGACAGPAVLAESGSAPSFGRSQRPLRARACETRAHGNESGADGGRRRRGLGGSLRGRRRS